MKLFKEKLVIFTKEELIKSPNNHESDGDRHSKVEDSHDKLVLHHVSLAMRRFLIEGINGVQKEVQRQ